jgi:hypothetical protein
MFSTFSFGSLPASPARETLLTARLPTGETALRLSLCSKDLWKLHPAQRGVHIRCLEGRTWVTCEGDQEDLILSPDEECTVQARGLVLISALSEATVEIDAAG